jgi:hypothetical protein
MPLLYRLHKDWNVFIIFLLLCSEYADAYLLLQGGPSWVHPLRLAAFLPFAHIQRRDSRRMMSAIDNSSSNEFSFLERVREGLRTEDAAWEREWDASLRILSELLVSSNNNENENCMSQILSLEAALAIAWNWKRWAIVTSPMARKFIRTIPPDRAMISSSIRWLQQGPLQLTNDIVLQGILQSPEAYLLNPSENYAQALRVAPPEYQDPSAFRALVLRHPGALRCTYNCGNTGCNSECGNCWVSLEYEMAAPRASTTADLL